MTALFTRMGTIKTADGYATDAGFNVSEWRSPYDKVEVTECPCISIYDTNDGWSPLSAGQQRYDHTMTITIEGLVTGSTAAAKARNLIKDIHAAINTDRSFGALVSEAKPQGDRLMVREAEYILMACQVTYEFKYETTNFDTE